MEQQDNLNKPFNAPSSNKNDENFAIPADKKPTPPRMIPPRINPQNINNRQSDNQNIETNELDNFENTNKVKPPVRNIVIQNVEDSPKPPEKIKKQKIFTNSDKEDEEVKDKGKSVKILIIIFAVVLIVGFGVFVYFVAIGSVFNFSSATRVNCSVESDLFSVIVYDENSNDITNHSVNMNKSDELTFSFTLNNTYTDSFVVRMKYNPIGSNKYDPSYCTLTLNNLNTYMYYYDGYYYYTSVFECLDNITIGGTITLIDSNNELKRKELVNQFVFETMEYSEFVNGVNNNSLNNNFGSAPLEWKQLIVGD